MLKHQYHQVYIRSLIEHVKLEVKAGHQELKKAITFFGVNRPGLELTGFYLPTDPSKKQPKILLFSFREFFYVQTLPRAVKLERYRRLINNYKPPMIVTTTRFCDSDLYQVADQLGCVVAESQEKNSAFVIRSILNYTDSFFSESEDIYGSIIDVYGIGVLIIGHSGIGKSEVVLELIKRNHLFVGDDRVRVFASNHTLIGRYDPVLKGYMEVRGVGIVDISRLFGYQYLLDQTHVELIIQLFDQQDIHIKNSRYTWEMDRLGQKLKKVRILGVSVPIINIPVFKGHDLASLIEMAVAKFKYEQKQHSINFVDQLNQRISKVATKQRQSINSFEQ